MFIYGGVLSLFVKFSITKNIKFVKIPIFGMKNRKTWKTEKLREKMSKIWTESSPLKKVTFDNKLSHKNDPNTASTRSIYLLLMQ